ncbi:hypothetical protein QQF64_022166 [Cirrhinus molitorella]|uniref:Uncharacterized protein n=1 Tax=Cirrhinus molitorella TaxID=172907 RepID=A0ABR3L7N9_9TELE
MEGQDKTLERVAMMREDSKTMAMLQRGSGLAGILWRGSGVEDTTNTGLAIFSVGYAGIHGWSSSLATGACPILPPPKNI